MRQFDLTPYRRSAIGFDRLFDMLETSTRQSTGDNYLKEDRAFITAVRTGNRKLIRCDFAEAVRSLQVSLAVNNSIKSGKVVKI